MKHGPIALIDEKMPVVAMATHDHVFEKMQGNIQEAKARGGSIIAITTKGDTTLKELLERRRLPGRSSCDTSAVDAGRDLSAVAAFVVLHRRPPRLRRRSAAQSGEERHGRIESSGTSEIFSLSLYYFMDLLSSLNPRSKKPYVRPTARC